MPEGILYWPQAVSYGDPLGETSVYVVDVSYGVSRATIKVEAANPEHAIYLVARDRGISFKAVPQ